MRLRLVFAGIVVLLAGVALVPGFLSYHDEPVVVDNGPILVRRAGATPMPENGNRRQWELHHSARLRQLYVWSWKDAASDPAGLSQPLSLSGVDDIAFDLVETTGGRPRETMRVLRDPWWKFILGQKARLYGSIEFAYDTGTKALTPADTSSAQALRVGQVRVRDVTICLRDDETPQVGACSTWNYTPWKVRVVICASPDKCPRPPFIE